MQKLWENTKTVLVRAGTCVVKYTKLLWGFIIKYAPVVWKKLCSAVQKLWSFLMKYTAKLLHLSEETDTRPVTICLCSFIVNIVLLLIIIL